MAAERKTSSLRQRLDNIGDEREQVKADNRLAASAVSIDRDDDDD